MAGRRWTLDGAREMIPEVRERTARAVAVTERLVAEREGHVAGSPAAVALDERIQQEVSRWAREMEALGLDVKGVWLVDFDTGGGYYCWKWPEEKLEFFHTYDEGFAGRTRIH